ncbi:MAG: OmpW family protein [Alcanivoracaceae bacterium]|jgi:outer membrane protein|nr:OmpW family protein [Alcanivoracaceae bacterium]
MKPVAAMLVLGSVVAMSPVAAYEQTDLVWRFSLTTMKPNVDSDLKTVAPVGAKVDMIQDTHLGLGLSYLISDHFGLGLHTSWPLKHNLFLDDGFSRTRAGSTRAMPVTVTLQYYLPKLGSAKPWVGIGRNYVRFSKESVGSGQSASADSMRLPSSNGFAGELGMDWDLDGNMAVSLSAIYAEAETRMVLSQSGATVDSVRFSFDPWIWNVGIARRF